MVHNLSSSKNCNIYKYIRHLCQSKSIPTQLQFNSTVAVTDAEKANLLNNYFSSVFTCSSFHPSSSSTIPVPQETLSNLDISITDVYTALASLDHTKAMGIDKMHPRILKMSATALCEPIHHLFTLCLSQSYLPLDWRTHCITPIHKAGDRTLASNFRPISLLCILSKVLECIVYNHIINFLLPQISNSQFGFQPGKSTLCQLLKFTSGVLDALDHKLHVDTIYLDFSKAFDSIPHEELLFKLRSFGITGQLWSWFQAYLTSRRQCVAVNGVLSTFLPVKSGVPQGSILGPLLFILYVNDLPIELYNSSIFLFADDTKGYKIIRSPTDRHLLQQDLDNICNWSRKWKLRLNSNKCSFTQFQLSHSSELPSYFVDGSPLTYKECHKDLGIFLVAIFPGLSTMDISYPRHINSYDFYEGLSVQALLTLKGNFIYLLFGHNLPIVLSFGDLT